MDRAKPIPSFGGIRLYTRLTAAEVRRQLLAQFGYTDEELPTAETIGTKLNELGYSLKKVAKTQPQKKSLKPMPSLRKAEASQRRGGCRRKDLADLDRY